MLAAASLLYFMRSSPRDAASVALQMPIQAPRWYVGQGGGSVLINQHARAATQRFALDISAVGPDGRRASGIVPAILQDYVAYGKPVTAPCDGVVAASEAALPDMPVGQADEINIAGNFIAIECKGVVVLLAHLQAGSVLLQRGATVSTGQTIGNVGNSGNTTEPHLHVHAVRGRYTNLKALMIEADAVSMTFDGRFLVRGDTGNSDALPLQPHRVVDRRDVLR